jgi:hypothetical protein
MTHFVFLIKLSCSFKPYLPRNSEILHFDFHIHFAQFLEFDQNGRSNAQLGYLGHFVCRYFKTQKMRC